MFVVTDVVVVCHAMMLFACLLPFLRLSAYFSILTDMGVIGKSYYPTATPCDLGQQKSEDIFKNSLNCLVFPSLLNSNAEHTTTLYVSSQKTGLFSAEARSSPSTLPQMVCNRFWSIQATNIIRTQGSPFPKLRKIVADTLFEKGIK